MAGIIHGRVTASSAGTAVQFTTLPTPIKYLLLEVPSENKGDVYIGGSTVASNNAPVLAKVRPGSLLSGMMSKRLPVIFLTFMYTLGIMEMWLTI